MWFVSITLVALSALAATAEHVQEQQYTPIPYQFNYRVESDGGSHSQQETSDANGRRQGSYTIALADGRQRTVNYVADENGFRAEVSTNELGTESKPAADVFYSSSAISGHEAALQYNGQRDEVPTHFETHSQRRASGGRVGAAVANTKKKFAHAPAVQYAAAETFRTPLQSAAVFNSLNSVAPVAVPSVASSSSSNNHNAADSQQVRFAYATNDGSQVQTQPHGHNDHNQYVAHQQV